MDIFIHDYFFQPECPIEDLGESLLQELQTPLNARMAAPALICQASRAVLLVSIEAWPSHIIFPEHLMPYCIFVSSQNQNPAALHYLELNCADFILPPLNPSYIAAKVRNLCRRLESFFVEGIVDGIEKKCVKHFTEKEYALLTYLVRVGIHGADREALTLAAWPGGAIHQKTLDTHLFNLRRKLAKAGAAVEFSAGRWRLVQ